MTGRDIALATLHREHVAEPCVNFCWMTNSSYMSRVAGRDYWSDREGVFVGLQHELGDFEERNARMRGRVRRLAHDVGIVVDLVDDLVPAG